jgi:hypothetical protein
LGGDQEVQMTREQEKAWDRVRCHVLHEYEILTTVEWNRLGIGEYVNDTERKARDKLWQKHWDEVLQPTLEKNMQVARTAFYLTHGVKP